MKYLNHACTEEYLRKEKELLLGWMLTCTLILECRDSVPRKRPEQATQHKQHVNDDHEATPLSHVSRL